MQRTRSKNKRAAAAIVLAMSVLLGPSFVAPSPLQPAFAAPAAANTPNDSAAAKPDSLTATDMYGKFEPYFAQTLADWTAKGYMPGTGTYTINGASISGQSDYKQAQAGAYQGKDNVLLWNSERDNWIEYRVRVDQAGLYQMKLHYHPYDPGNTSSLNRRPVQLAVTVDGEFTFREARVVVFRRLFKDELPIKRDFKDDDIRPRSAAINEWLDEPFRDSINAYSEPLRFYLTAGEHRIRLAGSEPIAVASLEIAPPQQLADYKQYAEQLPETKAASGKIVNFQAEEMGSKNDVAIQMAVNKDPLSIPLSQGNERFNTVGGTRWQNGGQTVSWTFEVPEDGRYKIALRALQNTLTNMAAYRTISIDGQIPFRELLEYKFPYANKWKGITLSDEADKPFEFYFAKGKHTIAMTATSSPFQPVIMQAEEATNLLREATAELKALTGAVVDVNRTWKITEEFPELPEKLRAVRERLAIMAEEQLKANGKPDDVYQTIQSVKRDLDSYLRYPNEIPYYMDSIASLQEKIGGMRDTLIKSPLQLDQFYIVSAGADMPKMEASFFQKTKSAITNFFLSFIKKEDITDLDQDALNVWVARGRDFVNLLQELSDELYTPQTGVRVKVNLLADENLLIYANAAGIEPDLVLGQPQDKSIDFAMRGALQDLSEFPDFEQIKNQFAPGSLMPYFYNEGYYALPETQQFKVMFYRKDIMQQLGLSIPDTWNDVYDMLPTLQQNGYNFYVPTGDFITFLYQNGADFFTKDGMQTALSTPEAFKGFKQWTDLFNIYDLEKSVPNFYQHFRKGYMPIGIADYTTYIQLSAAAPELAGWWGIAPLPGIKQADGTVARWSSGGQTSAFMYRNSLKKEAAWDYMKWLLSADTQERYGMDLESFNGITFRWPTANVEAFTRLPWSREDRNVILEQWKWYKEMANPPGAYFVGRELNNAWNRTVVDGMNYRESLEEAIVNIDREMVRKEQEFGFVASDGTVLHTLDLPQVTKPWEGVDRFVNK